MCFPPSELCESCEPVVMLKTDQQRRINFIIACACSAAMYLKVNWSRDHRLVEEACMLNGRQLASYWCQAHKSLGWVPWEPSRGHQVQGTPQAKDKKNITLDVHLHLQLKFCILFWAAIQLNTDILSTCSRNWPHWREITCYLGLLVKLHIGQHFPPRYSGPVLWASLSWILEIEHSYGAKARPNERSWGWVMIDQQPASSAFGFPAETEEMRMSHGKWWLYERRWSSLTGALAFNRNILGIFRLSQWINFNYQFVSWIA